MKLTNPLTLTGGGETCTCYATRTRTNTIPYGTEASAMAVREKAPNFPKATLGDTESRNPVFMGAASWLISSKHIMNCFQHIPKSCGTFHHFTPQH